MIHLWHTFNVESVTETRWHWCGKYAYTETSVLAICACGKLKSKGNLPNVHDNEVYKKVKYRSLSWQGWVLLLIALYSCNTGIRIQGTCLGKGNYCERTEGTWKNEQD